MALLLPLRESFELASTSSLIAFDAASDVKELVVLYMVVLRVIAPWDFC